MMPSHPSKPQQLSQSAGNAIITGINPIDCQGDFPGNPTSVQFQVSIIRHTSQFNQLAAEWDAFLSACGIENLALGYDWLQSVLKHFSQDRLLLITVRNERNELIGVAPFSIHGAQGGLFQQALRYVRFIGSYEFLYDWMCLPVRKDADEFTVIRLIADALRANQKDWDVVDLQSCLNKSQIDLLGKLLQRHGGKTELQASEAMPRMGLPSSLADYDADRSKKRVHRDVKRFHKKLHEALGTTATLQWMSPPSQDASQSDDLLDRFFEQHADYWLARTGKSSFRKFPQLSDFYKDILSTCQPGHGKPAFVFSAMRSEEKIFSYQFGIWYSWGYMNYMNSYCPDYKAFRTGILHMDAIIRQSVSEGASRFSFGQGEESYKDLWADEREALWNFRYFKSFPVSVCWQLDGELKRLKAYLRQPKNQLPQSEPVAENTKN